MAENSDEYAAGRSEASYSAMKQLCRRDILGFGSFEARYFETTLLGREATISKKEYGFGDNNTAGETSEVIMGSLIVRASAIILLHRRTTTAGTSMIPFSLNVPAYLHIIWA
jgi:hypothetical protein